MAQQVLTDVSVTVNSVDLSDHVISVSLTTEKDQVEITAMGDGWHKFTGGLGNASLTVEFQNDFASSSVWATIGPLVGTTTTVVVKPTSDAVAATNPSFTITDTFVSTAAPVDGSVGDLNTFSVDFVGGTYAEATS